MRLKWLALVALVLVSACSSKAKVFAPDDAVQTVRYAAPPPAEIRLFTSINRKSGSGAHSGMLISGSQRVLFDPAGTFEFGGAPERHDVLYGMNDRTLEVYYDFHVRPDFNLIEQRITVPQSVADDLILRAEAAGPVDDAMCSSSISALLAATPGFEGAEGVAVSQGAEQELWRLAGRGDADLGAGKLPSHAWRGVCGRKTGPGGHELSGLSRSEGGPLRIAGVILAGGAGQRMGGADKALLMLQGKPLIFHVSQRFAPQVSALAISANGDAARFAALGLPVLPDAQAKGPLSGLLAGLIWATALGADALASVPVDGPFLPADLVARLAEGAAAVPALAVAGGRRHAVYGLWPVGLAPALAAFLAGGAKARVQDFAESVGVVWVEFPDGAAFDNLNTPEDLARAEGRLA